jgi:hypothetical protein
VGQAGLMRVCRESALSDEDCAGCTNSERMRAPPRAPPLRRRRPEGSSFHCRFVSTDDLTHEHAPRGASVQARLQTGNGEQPKHQQCAPRGATAARQGFRTAPRIPALLGCSREHREVTVTAALLAVAAVSGLARTVASNSLDCSKEHESRRG